MTSILYVFPSLAAGGAEKAAILVANDLNRRYGYKVTFFTFMSEEYHRGLLHPEIELIQNNFYSEKTRVQRIFSSRFTFSSCLNKFIKQRNFDIVISGYEIDPELPIIQLIIKNLLSRKKSQTKFISIIQNTTKGSPARNRLVVKLVSYLRLFLFDKIIVVSPGIKSEFPSFIQNKIFVIPNPVDKSLIVQKAKQKIQRSNKSYVENPYFINVARISWQKNQLCLLRALNIIKEKIKENVLLVGAITDQKYYSQLQRYIRENDLGNRVFYAGTPENHFPYVRQAKAFVFVSRYEGYPLAVLEAMALEKLVISTKFNGYENLLSERNSLLIEQDDEKQLADTMLSVARGKVKSGSLIRRALSQVATNDVSKIADEYRKCFERAED